MTDPGNRWGRVDLSIAGRFRTVRQIQVYLALSSFQGGRDLCYPSLAAIRERMLENGIDLKERRISQIIGELRDLGLVEVHRAGLGRSNTYYVHPIVAESRETGSASKPAKLIRVSGRESGFAPQRRGSLRKEQEKRTSEKNREAPAENRELELKPQASLLERKTVQSDSVAARPGEPVVRSWADHRTDRERREAEERRAERERILRSCDEAIELLLPGLRGLRGVA